MEANEVIKQFDVQLDIKRSSSNREFEVVEGDNGNELVITLTDDGVPVDLAGCTVIAVFSKCDGRTAQQDNEGHGITVGGTNNNELTIELYTSSFAPGLVECEIQVLSGEETLVTSAKFNFSCRRAIFNSETVLATDEYPVLIELIQRNEAVEDAEVQRIAAESERTAAEELRIIKESLRISAENEREAVIEKWENPLMTALGLDIGATPTAQVDLGADSVNFTLGIPKSDSGVHIGADMPTEPYKNVWVDTSEGTTVTEYSGLGAYVGENQPAEAWEGRLWHKPSTQQNKIYVNGAFEDFFGARELRGFEKVLIYYGYPIAITSAWSVDEAVLVYKDYDVVVFGDEYFEPDHEVYAQTAAIMQKLTESYPKVKKTGYVPIGGSEGANLTMAELKRRVDLWQALGVQGIFLDEFGYDYGVTRERQNEIIAYVKNFGLFVFVNSWNTNYIFSALPMTIEWMPDFSPNPNGLAPLVDGFDYTLFETLFWSSTTDGTITPAPVYRMQDAFNYVNAPAAEYNGKSLYAQFGTKPILLDQIYSGADLELKKKLMSISLFGAKIFNCLGLAFGDEDWGAMGYYHQWDLPDFNLAEPGIHSVTYTEKTAANPNGETVTFPYKYTAVINGYKLELVWDIPHDLSADINIGERYILIDGTRIDNAWYKLYDFVGQIGEMQTTLNSAVAAASAAEANASQAQSYVESAVADIETLTTGFQYKSREW